MTSPQLTLFDRPAKAQAERQAKVDPWAKQRTRFHAASYTGSPRLQAVMAVLADGAWHSGIEIAKAASVLNPSGCISELNAPINNLGVESAYTGENENGRRVWRYRWVKKKD